MVRIGGPRRTQLAEQSHKNDSDEVKRIFCYIKNGKNESINNLRSVSMNRHVGSKRYEPSNAMRDTFFHSLKDFVNTKVPTSIRLRLQFIFIY